MVKYILSIVLLLSFTVVGQTNHFVEFNGMFVRPSEANSGLGYSLKYQREYSEDISFFLSFSQWNWGDMKNFRGYEGNGIVTEYYEDNSFYPLIVGVESNLHGDERFRSFLTFEMGTGYIDYKSFYQTEFYYQNSWGVGGFKKAENRNQWLFVAGVGLGFSHRAWEIIDLRLYSKLYKLGGDYEKFGNIGSIYLLTHFGISLLI